MSTLREVWERNARDVAAWFRTPGHDSYWRFHRDQFLELVPPPGRLTLDIGCGEGRLARDLKARGHHVVALDASPTMVSLAREGDPELEVHLGDAAALPFDDGCADLAIAFMSLQDVDDFGRAIAEAARVLAPGGAFVFAIVHPMNSAGKFESREEGAPFVVRGSYLDPFRYTDRFERDGLAATFESDHRPLEAYARALEDAGLLIEALREHKVPDGAASAPHLWQRIPLFLHVRARRP